jgi:ABC-type multidrug transport system fused ATPase/permease subunit
MFLLSGELAIKIRANLNEMIMKKIVKVSQMNLQDGQMTGIINLYNIELACIMQLCMTTFIVLIPLYFIVASIVLYFEIGVSGVIVHFSMLFTIPVSLSILQKLDSLKEKIGFLTRERLNWINSIVQGIKIIKIFAWEKVINDKVKKSRKKEIQLHLKKSIFKIISFTLVTSFQGAFILLTYWIKVKMGGSLEVNQVFCGVCILISSHFYITAGVSEGLMILKLIRICLKKITEIMQISEISNENYEEKLNLQLKSVFSSWNKYMSNEKSTDQFLLSEPGTFSLKDINFFLYPGQLCAVIGPVGSGKSTLLSTILKECNVFEGKVHKTGKICYLSQEPWIIQGTIRENILMGRSLEESRYKQILNVCELDSDISGMVLGDKTKVGEEGKLLSQGQKARISLARSIYQDSDIYLLDDPFAALDMKSIENIMQKCFFGILKEKTRVIVLNDIDLLPVFDKILLLNNGFLEFCGVYDNLLFDNNSMNMINNYMKSKGRKQRIKDRFLMDDKLKKKGIPLRDSQVFNRTIVGKNNYNYRFSLLYGFLMLGFKTWYLLVLFLIVSGSLQFFYIVHQYWISFWSSQSDSEQSSNYYPRILLIVTSIIITGTLLRNFFLYLIIFISSKNIHNEAVSAVLNSNLDVFYSKTPKEFIDSFSGDIFQIDENLTQAITFTIMFGMMILGYITYIIYVIPWNVINIAIFVICSTILTVKCLRTIVLLRQYYMLASGPITNICKETIVGIATVRSLELQTFLISRFKEKNLKLANRYLNFFYTLRGYTTLVSLGASFLLSINFLFVIVFLETYPPSLVAVSLSFNIGIMNILPWFYRLIIEIASLLPSLNRVHSYTLLSAESKTEQLPLSLTEGRIEFQNVTMAYTGFKELALCAMSFEVEPGKKFGIIGRSGSGKSSIFNAIYRLSRPISGKILVDGQDVNLFSLNSLRKQISFMSQNPFVFSGSFKFNVDPEGIHDNQEIVRLLNIVGLDEYVVNYGIHAEIKNLDLSVGQKQLLALCRVLIKESHIILLDEATANVDQETERIIEGVIDEHCAGKTLVTIAHKLKILRNYDLVMLVDNGCVVDILPPQMLLTREHTMVESTYKGKSAVYKESD